MSNTVLRTPWAHLVQEASLDVLIRPADTLHYAQGDFFSAPNLEFKVLHYNDLLLSFPLPLSLPPSLNYYLFEKSDILVIYVFFRTFYRN